MAFLIEDDILAPKGAILIEYKGLNPFSIYGKIRDMILTVFHARGVDYFEDDFRWDTTGEPINFFVRIHVDKKVDKWTRGYVYLRVQGSQPRDPLKPGWIQIEVSGKVSTAYPTETMFQKAIFYPFLYPYHYLMYNNIRRRYIRIYKEWIEHLEMEIRSTFNLMQRARLT